MNLEDHPTVERLGATILDAAEEAGVLIDNACRSGTCGSCRIRLLSGSVSMGCRMRSRRRTSRAATFWPPGEREGRR